MNQHGIHGEHYDCNCFTLITNTWSILCVIFAHVLCSLPVAHMCSFCPVEPIISDHVISMSATSKLKNVSCFQFKKSLILQSGGSYLKFSSQKKLWNNSTVLWKLKVWHTVLSVRWTAEPEKRCKQEKYSKVGLVFMEQFQKEKDFIHQYCLWEESYLMFKNVSESLKVTCYVVWQWK